MEIAFSISRDNINLTLFQWSFSQGEVKVQINEIIYEETIHPHKQRRNILQSQVSDKNILWTLHVVNEC